MQIKKVHQQKLMHEKCITPLVVTQILSYLDKHAKKEPAFLPKMKIKTHAYPKYNIENLCDKCIVSHKSIFVKKKIETIAKGIKTKRNR